MMTVTEKAFAKINLFLRVEKKRPDGYHDLTSVMHTVSLYDTVRIRKKPGNDIIFRCSVPELDGENNLCVRAARLFTEKYGTGGCEIILKQRIPWGAGLGGGSADCAAVLRGMNRLYGTGAGSEDLERLGAKLGADVPFLINGGAALARGIGEILTPLNRLYNACVLIIEGDAKTGTAGAFARIDGIKSKSHETDEKKDVRALIDAIGQNDLKTVGSLLFNDFEVLYNRDDRYALCRGAEGVCLTGSGSAVFAIYSDENEMKKDSDYIKKHGYKTHPCSTV